MTTKLRCEELIKLITQLSILKYPHSHMTYEIELKNSILIEMSNIDTRVGAMDAYLIDKITYIRSMIHVLE